VIRKGWPGPDALKEQGDAARLLDNITLKTNCVRCVLFFFCLFLFRIVDSMDKMAISPAAICPRHAFAIEQPAS
jgi:hypothetical protein